MKAVTTWLNGAGLWAPWLAVGIFIAASFLIIWRLESMNRGGFEGTVLGTLVMPYCSGIGNLIFAFLIGSQGSSGSEVLTNSLVNNVTNLTLVLGLPAILWNMNLFPQAESKRKKKKKDNNQKQEREVNRLSLLLTLTAALFFTGATWVVGKDGKIDAVEGIILIGLFLFWQSFHVFEVLKSNVRQNRSFGWMLPIDLALLGVGAYAIYITTDWLVNWVSGIHSGFISAKNLGWLSGWLMVLPNALLAVYYARRGNPEVVYASQVGDGHISIPLCIGICALYAPIRVPGFFQTGIVLLAGAIMLHFFFVALFGRLPKWTGWVLCAAYLLFLYKGLG